MGEDEIISTMEYQPQEEMTLETCLKGVLNTHESESFSVQPSTVTFINPVAGQSYTVTALTTNFALASNFSNNVRIINS